MISASPLRAVVKVTESERHEDNESDDELERDISDRNISPNRKSALRDDSESMRTERENFIQGFECMQNYSEYVVMFFIKHKKWKMRTFILFPPYMLWMQGNIMK